jgi:hypothetical protein
MLFNTFKWALLLRGEQRLSVGDQDAEGVEELTGDWRKFRNNALCLLFSAYRSLFPWGKSGRGVSLTTHLHLVSRIRMREAIPLRPPYAS